MNTHAAAVLDQLLIQNGEEITVRDLAARIGISVRQTQRGIATLRDHLASVNSVSYVATRGGGGGVALTKNPERANEYAETSAQIAATQLSRVLSGTVDSMVKNATTRAGKRDARAIQRHLARMVEDLQTFRDNDTPQAVAS